MRIAYITAATIPSRAASSIQVMKMADAFADCGHETVLIAPATPNGDEDSYRFYGVSRTFAMKRVRRLPLKEAGMLLWGHQAVRWACTWGPDLVYCRQLHASAFSSLWGLPTILEIHEPPNTTISRFLFRQVLNRSPRRVVTNSHSLKAILEAEFPEANGMILAAPNGAEDPGPPQNGFPESHKENLTIGYVGHLYQGRGIDLIVEMARRCPWAEFHLFGGRDGDLATWRKEAEPIKNLALHGFVPPASVEACRQSCDVLIAPYPWKTLTRKMRNQADYMSPLKVFEYMASGKAILSSDIPTIREILSHEETALLCDPDDVESWVASLMRLRDDPALQMCLGRTAREVFLRKYTRKARIRRILEGIQQERVEEPTASD